MPTRTLRTALLLITIIALAPALFAAPATQPAATQPTATAPASRPGTVNLPFEPMPDGFVGMWTMQGMGGMKTPTTMPALARSDRAVLWHDTNTGYLSALLFDESGGTGTGFDTLHVDLEGQEDFTGQVTTYKPLESDVSKDTPHKKFDMVFHGVRVLRSGPARPEPVCRITFKGWRTAEAEPDATLSFGGRIYPQYWARGTILLDGKPLQAAVIDENRNGRFTDRVGLDPKAPEGGPSRGDYLVLGLDGEQELQPESGRPDQPQGSVRLGVTKYLVLNSGTYEMNIEQSSSGLHLDLTPVKIPAGKVEFSDRMPSNRLMLIGIRTCAYLIDPPEEVALPVDIYDVSGFGGPPYPVEPEEGLTVGPPFDPPKTLAVTVLQPDGKPAAAAEYTVLKGSNWANVTNGGFEKRYGADIRKAGPDGTLTMRSDLKDCLLVVLHETGWKEASRESLEAAPRITLQPWGRIEGTVLVNDKPGAGERIDLTYHRIFRQNGPNVMYDSQTIANEAGKFVIERAVPGQGSIGRTKSSGNRRRTVSSTLISVNAGKTVTVKIGGAGRNIIGRITASDEAQARLRAADLDGSLQENRGHKDISYITPPKDWLDMTAQQQRQWRQQWIESHPEAKKLADNPPRHYTVQTEPDGRFTIEDVRPGTYELSLSANEPVPGQADAVTPFAQFEQEVVVPELPESLSGVSMDLGSLSITTFKPVTASDPAPEMTMTDIHGKPLKLADLRGKYVLLDFRPPTNAASWLDDLKALHKPIARADRIVLITIYPGRMPEDFPAYAAQKGLTWPQVFTDDWTLFHNFDMPSQGSMFLIDPAGRILAWQDTIEQIKPLVAKALAGEPLAVQSAPASEPTQATKGQ